MFARPASRLVGIERCQRGGREAPHQQPDAKQQFPKELGGDEEAMSGRANLEVAEHHATSCKEEGWATDETEDRDEARQQPGLPHHVPKDQAIATTVFVFWFFFVC